MRLASIPHTLIPVNSVTIGVKKRHGGRQAFRASKVVYAPFKILLQKVKATPWRGSRSSCSISKLSAGGGGNLGLEGTLLGLSTLERGGASFSESASEGLCKGAGVGFGSNPLLAEGGIRAGPGSAEGAGPAASSGTTGSADDAAAAAGEDLRGSGKGCMPQS